MSCVDDVYESLKKDGRARVQKKTIQGWKDEIEERGVYDPATITQELVERGRERIRKAYLERRNRALMVQSEIDFYGYVKSQFAKDPHKGIIAYLGGVQSYKKGSRLSAAVKQEQLRNKYLNDMTYGLRRAGLWQAFRSGELDDQIMYELADLSSDAPTGKATTSKQAKEIAKIIRSVQEEARIRANSAGADIGKLQGYITAQTHDMFKIGAVSEDDWVSFVLGRLDKAKTFGNGNISDAAATKILRGIYGDFKSGEHIRIKFEPPALADRPRTTNVGGSLSQERFLHFNGTKESIEYNKQFGRGSLRENLVENLSGMAKKTALMESLGPNPREVLDRVYARLRNDLGTDAKVKLANASTNIDNLMSVLDGSSAVPGNAMAAKYWQIYRDVQSMSKLGGAVISAISDIPIAASELRYQGQGVLSPYYHATIGAFNNIPRERRRELAAMIGVYNDSMIHNMVERFSGYQDFSGKASRATATFFKISGLTDWTERMRINVSLAMAARLGVVADSAYKNMDDDLKRTLGLFGIEEREWQVISKAVESESGQKFITPEAIRNVDSAVIAKYFPEQDEAKVRRILEDKLRSYYIDRTDTAVIRPDARTASFMRQGSAPGTVKGEFFRLIMQFKGFPLAVMQKVGGRTLHGKEQFGASGFMEVAHIMAMTTGFGYLSMAAKDILKGREPRDPLLPSTISAAMLQGGAMGIYGDFILGTSNRFGGGITESLAGPGIGTMADTAELLMSIRDGDDPRAKALKLVQGNTPFANLFYLRTAMDYGFMYQLQETLDPGYLRRMERRVERDQKQNFMWRPSDHVPYGGGF